MTPFNEHQQAFSNNRDSSDFSKHVLENQHPIDTIDKIMESLYTIRNRSDLNTVEKYFICRETININQDSDQNTMEQNAIFSTVFQLDR